MIAGICSALSCAQKPASLAVLQPAQTASLPPADQLEIHPLDLQLQANQLADQLMERVSLPADAKVAVLPLVCPNGGTTTLGFLIAEKIASRLTESKRYWVVDRTHLSAVIAEKDLAYTDLSSASQAEVMAKLLSADYLLTGTLVDTGHQVDLTAKLLDGRVGTALAAQGLQITKTDDVETMLTYVQRPKADGGELPPLSLNYQLRCRRNGEDVVLRDGSTVRSGDAFRICLQANSDCYAYVLLLDSIGRASVLFPHPKILCGNVMKGGVEYVIPPQNQPPELQWFLFDNNPGTERFYILASYEPIAKMDDLLREIERADSNSSTAIASVEALYSKGTKGIEGVTLKDGFRVARRCVEIGVSPIGGVQPVSRKDQALDAVKGVTSLVQRIGVRHVP